MADHAKRAILILVNEMFDSAGGNLRAAVNVAEAMALHQDSDITFSAPFVRTDPHETVDRLDARVTRKVFPATRLLARFGGSVRQFFWLTRHIRRFDQVQVHSLFHLSAVYAILLCAIRGVPVLLWPHGTLDPFDLDKHARLKQTVGPLVTRRLLERCTALIFTNRHESEIAVTYGARTRHEVVALPVEPILSTPAAGLQFRGRIGVDPHVPVVLFLGRINYKKGLPLLVEAISHLNDTNVHLVVVGDGEAEEMQRFRSAVERYGLVDRVRTTGWIEGDLRAAAYEAADVFALLSDAENFGLALVEALSAGLPAVISNGVFLADDLAQAGAVVIADREALSTAAGLARVLADRSEAAAMGARGRMYVARHFDPAAVGERLHNLSGPTCL